jgi:hypothetical protein
MVPNSENFEFLRWNSKFMAVKALRLQKLEDGLDSKWIVDRSR